MACAHSHIWDPFPAAVPGFPAQGALCVGLQARNHNALDVVRFALHPRAPVALAGAVRSVACEAFQCTAAALQQIVATATSMGPAAAGSGGAGGAGGGAGGGSGAGGGTLPHVFAAADSRGRGGNGGDRFRGGHGGGGIGGSGHAAPSVGALDFARQLAEAEAAAGSEYFVSDGVFDGKGMFKFKFKRRIASGGGVSTGRCIRAKQRVHNCGAYSRRDKLKSPRCDAVKCSRRLNGHALVGGGRIGRHRD